MHHFPAFKWSVLTALSLLFLAPVMAQERPQDALEYVRAQLVGMGYMPEDVADLVEKDRYRDAHNGVEHIFLRQRWKGIEVFNGDIALHRTADGRVLQMHNGSWPHVAKTVDATEPVLSAAQAMAKVLGGDLPGVRIPSVVKATDGWKTTYEAEGFNDEPVTVQLMYQTTDSLLRLVWNVNYYAPGAAHWWNVRISALTGEELDRNDWVSDCGFHEALEERVVEEVPAAAPPPAAPLDYRVYHVPVESPSHGGRTIVNAPWAAAGIASPYGWHDTNGAPGAEYTITRGNNVHAQEDANGNNGTGYSPDGGASLDFDFPINLGQQPIDYQDAALTNLFHWNNLMHDIWYQYGFNEVSGNFQQNNYGRGGQGEDYVLADGQDGSGINNANFGTPPDGSRPRMQMFLWNQTTPMRDGDLDNGIIAHEYGHGISNRLVGGPSNVNCLNNDEQMGEGWSDFFGLVMTIEPGDVGTDPRGIGTYAIGEPTNGPGIRPAPYSTSFAVNDFTYASTTNPTYQTVHSIGFIWCTMLWDLTWDLIDEYGFDPDLYTGTGGNNIAMQLVIDGLKLTACSPGFVDGRDAILQADVINNGGANQDLIWSAFARRGLGYSAQQGSTNNLNDQVETFDMPLDKNVGIAEAVPLGQQSVCADMPLYVTALVRNNGLEDQSNIMVRYSLNGGAYVTEPFPGTLAAGASVSFTFTQPLAIDAPGGHTLVVGTVLAGDEFPGDDAVTNAINAVFVEPVLPPLQDGAENGTVPAGWSLQNPDNNSTWTTSSVTNGPTCASTTAWMINYNTYSAVGQEDRLLTPPIDLTASSGAQLTFDHAYARYNSSYFDAFRVDISSDCGTTWTTLFEASGSALATAPDNQGNNWAPTNCDQWAAHNISLSDYDGQAVVLRFVGICGYGQRLYLDNIRVHVPTQNDVAVDAVIPEGELPACATSTPVTATLRNVGEDPQSGFDVSYILDGGTPVTETYTGTLAPGATADFTFAQVLSLAPGTHTLEVTTLLDGDQNPANDLRTVQLDLPSPASLPVGDGAEAGTVPPGWVLENPDAGITWTTTTVNNGPLCASTSAWMINYYGYSSQGQEDRLLTAPIDLSTSSGAALTFHHAYARYNGSYFDAFRVDISSDCGESWTNLYEAEGSALATASDNNGGNWAPANCSEWAAHDIDLSAYDGQTVILRFVGICGYGQRLYLDNILVDGNPIAATASVRVLLDGCYEAAQDRMHDQLRTQGLVPLEEPYTALGHVLPGGGGEIAEPALLAVTGDDAIVDWVLVELRSAAEPGQVIAARCALLQRDGDVVDASGSAQLQFTASAGSYHVAVRHRNHLGIMTADAVELGATLPVVDFSLGTTATYGTAAQRERNGKWMLWAGNVNGDTQLKYTGAGNDREPILQAIGSSTSTSEVNGYLPTDVNLDGVVKYTGPANDRDALLLRVGGEVPTAVRNAQLP